MGRGKRRIGFVAHAIVAFLGRILKLFANLFLQLVLIGQATLFNCILAANAKRRTCVHASSVHASSTFISNLKQRNISAPFVIFLYTCLLPPHPIFLPVQMHAKPAQCNQQILTRKPASKKSWRNVTNASVVPFVALTTTPMSTRMAVMLRMAALHPPSPPQLLLLQTRRTAPT